MNIRPSCSYEDHWEWAMAGEGCSTVLKSQGLALHASAVVAALVRERASRRNEEIGQPPRPFIPPGTRPAGFTATKR